MTKQVLDVQQMQHLQELGLELKETMLNWARCVDNDPRAATHYEKWILIKGNKCQVVRLEHWEFVPAYTLQDVFDKIPSEIRPNDKSYWFRIDFSDECLYYYHECYDFIEHRKKIFDYCGMDGLIDAAYSMLCWCIENGYIETNKNE